MRLYILGFILLLGSCQATDKYQTKAILEVMNAQVEAWNRGDIKGFMQGYEKSDSLQFITAKGIKYGYDSVLNSYLRSYDSRDKMGKLSFTELRVKQLDQAFQTAHVTGKWNILSEKSPSGHFSLIFRRNSEGEWKIVIDHTW